jgi:hypothetical protein
MFVPHVVRMLLFGCILLYQNKWLLFYILKLFSQLLCVIVIEKYIPLSIYSLMTSLLMS